MRDADEPARPVPEADRPGPGRMVARGLARRCPWCGGRPLFEGWFGVVDRCPRCGLRLQRQEGQMTGHIGVNTIVTFTVLFLVVAVQVVVGYPGFDTTRLWISAGLVAVVFPIVFQPISRTLWLAIDLAARPPEAGELGPTPGGGDAGTPAPPGTDRANASDDGPGLGA